MFFRCNRFGATSVLSQSRSIRSITEHQEPPHHMFEPDRKLGRADTSLGFLLRTLLWVNQFRISQAAPWASQSITSMISSQTRHRHSEDQTQKPEDQIQRILHNRWPHRRSSQAAAIVPIVCHRQLLPTGPEASTCQHHDRAPNRQS